MRPSKSENKNLLREAKPIQLDKEQYGKIPITKATACFLLRKDVKAALGTTYIGQQEHDVMLIILCFIPHTC